MTHTPDNEHWESVLDHLPNYGGTAAEAKIRWDSQPELLTALVSLVKQSPFVPVKGGIQVNISMEQIAKANAAIDKATN